jgi:frataxin-like iron-binding protein CyaY
MDRQEFEAIAREALEGVGRTIEELALDGLETYQAEDGLQLMFDSGAMLRLRRDDAAQQLELEREKDVVVFYFDPVEESWFARGSELSLRDVLSAEISARLAQSVTLADPA